MYKLFPAARVKSKSNEEFVRGLQKKKKKKKTNKTKQQKKGGGGQLFKV
jgi:hypothetical protein